VFDESVSTDHVYKNVAMKVVNSALKGINGTVFAYG
jgi:hypothetical protein